MSGAFAAIVARHVIMHQSRLYARSFCLPGYTPRGWWECDVFEITEAGYFREYEIKSTRADFLADRTKRHEPHYVRRDGKWALEYGETKHECLARGDPRGPVQFWYVTPAGLVAPADLPPWAGLIELALNGSRWRGVEVKAAPRLHDAKVDEKVSQRARATCYWRMHELLRRAEHAYMDKAEWEVMP